MPFQVMTVKDAIEAIERKKFLLPAIQREVVWKVEQITRLFDSLMRDFPIGSFLFWDVKGENVGKYQFYEFMRDFHEVKNRHNQKASIHGQEDITGILDGQQRLTALYIGLKGSYAYKLPRKRWDNPLAFPKRMLYVNLLAPKQDDPDEFYNFAFLTDDEVRRTREGFYWFKVGDILKFDGISDLPDFYTQPDILSKPQDQARFAIRTLTKLWAVIHQDSAINYYLEKDDSLDKVLKVFIRVNSGGTILSYSDLLLSIATAQWEGRDAREEVTTLVDDLNSLGGFSFNKDFVLKSSVVLADINDIAFKVDNFNRENMSKIQQEWDNITLALRNAVILIAGFGYDGDRLTSNHAVTPIAFYLKTVGCPHNFDTSAAHKQERDAIQKWLIYSLVKRVFGGVPDTVLRGNREVLRGDHEGFPLEQIINHFRGTSKSLIFTGDDVENILSLQYGQGYTFSILALLYPWLDLRHKIDIDHIHPKGHFTAAQLRRRGVPEADIQHYMDNVNGIPNLQLIEGTQNQEKSNSDFRAWFEQTHATQNDKDSYRSRNYIPNVELSLLGFKEFFEQRKELMRKKLEQLLGVDDHQEDAENTE